MGVPPVSDLIWEAVTRSLAPDLSLLIWDGPLQKYSPDQPRDEQGRFGEGDVSHLVVDQEHVPEMLHTGVPLDIHAFRGSSAGADVSSYGWFTTDRAEAERYAAASAKITGTEPVVTDHSLRSENPYVTTSSAEMINAGTGTIDRLRAEGYDAMVFRHNGGIAWPGEAAPLPRVWVFPIVLPSEKSVNRLTKGLPKASRLAAEREPALQAALVRAWKAHAAGVDLHALAAAVSRGGDAGAALGAIRPTALGLAQSKVLKAALVPAVQDGIRLGVEPLAHVGVRAKDTDGHVKYSADQPRDDHGRFGEGTGQGGDAWGAVEHVYDPSLALSAVANLPPLAQGSITRAEAYVVNPLEAGASADAANAASRWLNEHHGLPMHWEQQTVAATTIASFQQYLDADHLKEMAPRMRSVLEHEHAAAYGFEHGGKVWLQDGNHRTNLLILGGVTSIPVLIRKVQDAVKSVDGPWEDVPPGFTPSPPMPEDAETKGGQGSGNFGHAGRPGEVGGSGEGGSGVPQDGQVSAAGLDSRFPLAKEIVDGRTIPDFHDESGPDVPNMGSISASLTDYEILDGVREVQMSAFEDNGKPSFYSTTEESRVTALAEEIRQSKEITPLIVVVDKEKFPYVLEGGHRFDALRLLGAKSFPALVVVDTEDLEIVADKAAKGGAGSGNFGHEGRPGEVGGSGSGGGRGEGGESTDVGMTSSRPGRPSREVFQQMREFDKKLQAIPGVHDVSVQPGLGAWQGGHEPTWVVHYVGNGAATKLLAETGKKYDQDAILVMRSGGSDPATEWHFASAVGSVQRDKVGAVLTEHGIGGWTWYKSGGRTVLRAVSVPAWGSTATAHVLASHEISLGMTQKGLTHTMSIGHVAATVMERSGAHSYDSVIGGAK